MFIGSKYQKINRENCEKKITGDDGVYLLVGGERAVCDEFQSFYYLNLWVMTYGMNAQLV